MSLRLDIDRLQRRFLAGDESARADLRQLLQRYVRMIAARAMRHPTPESAIERRILELTMRAGLESFLASDQIQSLAFEIADRLCNELLARPIVQPMDGKSGSTILGPGENTICVERC